MVVRQQRQPELLVVPDPLFLAWGPPANETCAQRAVREAEEKGARLVSERIDEEICKEKYRKKERLVVKVILLGQEGSGVSPYTPADHVFFSPLLTSSMCACREVCIFKRSVGNPLSLVDCQCVLKYIW